MKKTIVLLAALLATSALYAKTQVICPDVNAIASEKVQFDGTDALAPHKLYYYFEISHYQTKQDWTVVVAPVWAKSADNALTFGKQTLRQLAIPGELGVSELGEVYCNYNTGNPELTVTAYPEDNFNRFDVLRKRK